MWFSFWRSRDRFSLDELRYLTDQLMKVQVVNEVNKDFVIEALRSIAELITYGDQHDLSFFEYFMEKQVMGEFVRILKISRTITVSLQLLQTMSIMIQNLKNEQAIYYMFSNEHINFLITFSFDFRNEELLSYYISFLRAISGKLNKNTISLLVKTHNDEIASFPLYVEGIRFAFHEESMVRTAIRALTLNVYHVGDECVNNYVASAPHGDYFLSLVKYFREQCLTLNRLVSDVSKNRNSESTSTILSAADEIEDNLYYVSDVISAGIPDVGRLITDAMLKLLIFPMLLPSLGKEAVKGIEIGAVTSLYLLCCILRIVKIKDLANIVATALFCPLETFAPSSGLKLNGPMSDNVFSGESQMLDNYDDNQEVPYGIPKVSGPDSSSWPHLQLADEVLEECNGSHISLREALLSYVISGDDCQVLGSLSLLATLLQTKELDESMLDSLGILPQRKQHKKLLLQALVGEGSAEEQLFSSESSSIRDGITSELDSYLQRLQDQYGVSCSCSEVGVSARARAHRFQVLDALISVFCRSNISAETLWDGGWLLRQLLPYSEAEFNKHHLKLLRDSYKNCTRGLLAEARGTWPDLLITMLFDEWKKCKRAIEASSPRRDLRRLLLPVQKPCPEEVIPGESSFTAGERMSEMVKVFVLLHQLQIFALGRPLPDQPGIHPPLDILENSRAKAAGLDASGPKPGSEIKVVDAVPCRISFERGKERHFCFLALSVGISGWLVLAEELPLKPGCGIVRVSAPLAGCNPKGDDKHARWLHLRIRPSTIHHVDTAKSSAQGKTKSNALVDGRWTLAFRNEDTCKFALSMILEEMNLQSNEVERRLKPLLDFERDVDFPNVSQPLEVSPARTPLNSL